jgi:hypothetical protein
MEAGIWGTELNYHAKSVYLVIGSTDTVTVTRDASSQA